MKEALWAAGLASASGLTSLLPDAARYAVARGAGGAMANLFADKYAAVVENLRTINAWSGKSFEAERVFQNFGMTLSDFFSRKAIEVKVEGRERAQTARRAGKGMLFLTTHLGNWELGGRILTEWGWPVTAVYQPYRSKAMQSFIQNHRAAGLRYLAVGKGAARGVARLLEAHETVAMLADRPFGEQGEAVQLCGKPARLPRGPFLFACRFGAPIVPGFILMESPGKYRAVIEEPIWPQGRSPAAVQDLLDKMAKVLEKYLAGHADQWYCLERVWE